MKTEEPMASAIAKMIGGTCPRCGRRRGAHQLKKDGCRDQKDCKRAARPRSRHKLRRKARRGRA